jgi:hypothetical protein
MRRFAFCSLLATTSISFAACSAPSKGALILAISTDMQAPKDIDVVSLYIVTNGVVKFDYMGRVLPDGTVSLPSTLALVEPEVLDAPVSIRVTAFQTQPDGSAKARVLRDVLTTVPHERTALLRLPLDFLDDGSVTGTLPATYVPDPANGVPEGDTSYGPTDPVPSDPGYLTTVCDYSQGLTSVAGSCVSDAIDSSQAPDYADNEVFGDGGTVTVPACFAVTNCFQQKTVQQNIAMASDGSCNFPIAAGENGQNWNCALATTDGTGTCIGQDGRPPCLVPLESDPGEGFTIEPGQQDQMGQVTMVPGVCKKLMAGAQLYLDKSSCPTKVEAAPVCQPGATGGGSGQAVDASTPTTDAGEALPDASIQADDASACVEFGGTCISTPQCCGSNSSCSFSAKGGTCMPLASGADTGVAPQDAGSAATEDASAVWDAGPGCPSTQPPDLSTCNVDAGVGNCSYPSGMLCRCTAGEWECMAP